MFMSAGHQHGGQCRPGSLQTGALKQALGTFPGLEADGRGKGIRGWARPGIGVVGAVF